MKTRYLLVVAFSTVGIRLLAGTGGANDSYLLVGSVVVILLIIFGSIIGFHAIKTCLQKKLQHQTDESQSSTEV
ncbi:MAG: hypothetical protein Q8O72_03835 [Bacteroidales bacterium]|jgi:hypothetical protein|nr:hypothetical protein [Bacteroidales bacterium]